MYGNSVLSGQHQVDRTPLQLAVIRFRGRPGEPGCLPVSPTGAAGGKRSSQHEAWRQSGDSVDHLLIIAGAQRGDHNRLRFATREQGRAVRARQDVHFGFSARIWRTSPGDAALGREDVAHGRGGFGHLEDRLDLRFGPKRGIGAHRKKVLLSRALPEEPDVPSWW